MRPLKHQFLFWKTNSSSQKTILRLEHKLLLWNRNLFFWNTNSFYKTQFLLLKHKVFFWNTNFSNWITNSSSERQIRSLKHMFSWDTNSSKTWILFWNKILPLRYKFLSWNTNSFSETPNLSLSHLDQWEREEACMIIFPKGVENHAFHWQEPIIYWPCCVDMKAWPRPGIQGIAALARIQFALDFHVSCIGLIPFCQWCSWSRFWDMELTIDPLGIYQGLAKAFLTASTQVHWSLKGLVWLPCLGPPRYAVIH